MTKQSDLTAYVFEGQTHLISGVLMQWMEASPRFTAFVETYRDKIRKKVRVTRDPESILDLRSELEVAYCLLKDRRLAAAYEPYASVKRRGPDFAVTYRANQIFNVEVARLRAAGIDIPHKEERILRILLNKLGQMQQGMANLLVIYSDDELVRSLDLGRLMQELKTRADGKDVDFYSTTGYSSPAAFYKDFRRLSGIALWAASAQIWVNKQAQTALPEIIVRLIRSLPNQ